MCGIVGYVGFRAARVVLFNALKRMEYRGYDSVGMAVLKDDVIQLSKRRGYVDSLHVDFEGTVGIAHTRWATHGKPDDRNAHPFTDCRGDFAIVHNGIIENYSALRKMLAGAGHEFVSDTDSEVIAHLLEEHYDGDFKDAFFKMVSELRGSFAIVAVHRGERRIMGAKNESPLVVGIGDHENFVASDIPAFLDYTNRVISLSDGEICEITEDRVKVYDFDGHPVAKKVQFIDWSVEDAERGGFEHFMLKEIYEQPRALEETLHNLQSREVKLPGRTEKISFVACGTSYHASLFGKYMVERYLGIPAETHYGSEYRYRDKVRENPLVVLITQSGETADTLASARIARRRNFRTIAITNVLGSSITNYVDAVFFTSAGPEIGVAATKTFTTQMIALHYLILETALAWRRISRTVYDRSMAALRDVPHMVDRVLEIDDRIMGLAQKLAKKHDMYYIARGMSYPVALEGALKMKEISYLHAEAYPAGELKHGPLALIDEDVPVIAVVLKDKTYEKMLSNLREVSARGAYVIAISTEEEVGDYADSLLILPESIPETGVYPATVLLQLLAYHTARVLGREIDKPKNLAKSVTVE
ncbi:MAG: glutamine--fructose-6-phosphate transaminase (isomerizing) [Euryarchaeota archaeon]|nr:glutamine--fructose-6-phosphate transaminase (isomerizing) [Euryarchaeota archaeon]